MSGTGRPFESQIERIIRTCEILAVARALQSGEMPRVGQCIDYYLEPEASGLVTGARSPRQGKPYRTRIEQRHLDAAQRMLKESSRTY